MDAVPDKASVAEYLADNYGECIKLPDCECHKQHVWLGRRCANWKPIGARSWEELKAMIRKR